MRKRGYTHRESRREHRRAAHHHTLNARRRPRPQPGPPDRHRKRKRARPQHPGLEARTPKGHGTKAQAPREGNSADTYPTHQPQRHTQTPTALTQRATAQLTAPPSHQPATLRPELRTTTRAGLTSTEAPRHNTRQHSKWHRSAPQCNAPRQGSPRHNPPQHDAARRGTARHTTARHGATRHNKAGLTATQHGPARRSTEKHGTTQHGTPQSTTKRKQGTLTEGLTQRSRRTPRKAPHQPATHQQGATAPPATTVAVCAHKTLPESQFQHRGGRSTPKTPAPLTQGLTKSPGATAQPAEPEPNPARRATEASVYITHKTHVAGARPSKPQAPTATWLTTPNADQCVLEPREGRRRAGKPPPPKRTGGAGERLRFEV